ncbi:MAG: hypothetical protein ACI8V2_001028 [Candidatus Latescibacterota bacterium]|jgi:hypothetical protein
MTWAGVTLRIRRILASQDRKNPHIRLNALDNLERLLRMQMPEVIGHPEVILELDKAVVIEMLEQIKRLNGAERSVLNTVYQVLSGENKAVSSQVHEITSAPKRKEHKLKPLAEFVSEIFEQFFNCSAPYTLEAQPSWLLSVPDQAVYRDVWDDVSAVYETLVDGRWGLRDRLQEYAEDLKGGRQRVDIWFDEPFNCMVEFDETQHFNPFRLKTLQAWQGYANCSFDYDHYLALAGATTIPAGTTGFQRLKNFDPLFPPMLAGEAQDNRIRQRAFRDFLKDITPLVVPRMNPTIRISYMITSGRIRDFTAGDLKAVEEYMMRCGVLERMRLA